MSSGFISETEIVEARRRRQEEWEKVRTADQPQEAPEDPYDTRPLFQRLEEQRLKKEAEYEEAHKLKNMIRGLDDDEVGFLDLVEESKAKAAQMISMEERKEIQEFRERVSSLAESEEMSRLRAQLAPTRAPAQPSHNSQKNKLQGVVVRKRKASDMDGDTAPAKSNGRVRGTPGSEATPVSEGQGSEVTPVAGGGKMTCVGVLPGLGHYDTDSTSDSEDSSSSDPDDCCTKHDILGRHVQDKKKEETKS